MSKHKNLNDPFDIKRAFHEKGKGSMTLFAQHCNVSLAFISHNVHGLKKTEHILQKMANYLGHTVYGVEPKKTRQPAPEEVGNTEKVPSPVHIAG